LFFNIIQKCYSHNYTNEKQAYYCRLLSHYNEFMFDRTDRPGHTDGRTPNRYFMPDLQRVAAPDATKQFCPVWSGGVNWALRLPLDATSV